MQLTHLALVAILNFSTLSGAVDCNGPPADCIYGKPGGSWVPCTGADKLCKDDICVNGNTAHTCCKKPLGGTGESYREEYCIKPRK
ncbi:hypothetical protein FKW77_006282 [Venturia effusa]|uniref:Uncharacterized protein n=1 Tax=Venturia effusa TaxID=50376 RepID=A0A517LLN7_9PEZI|nr:hypothetical protein FKW77_006282 [Venturia effusa]